MSLASTDSPEIAQLFAADSAPPYANGAAELAAHLDRLHVVLRGAVRRFRSGRDDGDGRGTGGIAVFDAEIDRFLAGPAPFDVDGPEFGDIGNQLEAGRRHCLLRSYASAVVGRVQPFAAICDSFGLTAEEADILLLCVAWELHPAYGRLFAYLHDDMARKRPSVELASDLFAHGWESRLELIRLMGSGASLLRHGLIHAIGGEGPTTELSIDPAVLDTLLGGTFERSLNPVASEIRLDRLLVGSSERATLTEFADLLRHADADAGGPVFVVLYGPQGVGRRSAAAALCSRAGLRLYEHEATVDTPAAVMSLRPWLRQVRIAGGVPLIRIAVEPGERHDVGGELARLARDCGLAGCIVIAEASAATRLRWPDFVNALILELSPPAAELRWKAWREALRDNGLTCAEEELRAVATVYPLTVGNIRRAVEAAAGRAPKGSRRSRIGRAELAEACRERTSHHLGRLAQRSATSYGWGDIVLPADELERLREIADAVRNRDRVQARWGFDRIGFGRGINALFFGPSGTGKTMAASILANDLGMEMFRIDLSRVVSKYIGETEKNLDAIFDEAQRAFALLFFDEAEALFGKRSEVKDAHDRYSNIETAYLLQRIEVFDGVAILATNLRNNMDGAFSRRLQFAVEFPLPGHEERLRIWRKAWPDAALIAPDVDLDFMARNFELAGGHIRNIALTSAYLAARDDGPVTMANLIAATRREFQKLGRMCLDDQFGKYAHLARGSDR